MAEEKKECTECTNCTCADKDDKTLRAINKRLNAWIEKYNGCSEPAYSYEERDPEYDLDKPAAKKKRCDTSCADCKSCK